MNFKLASHGFSLTQDCPLSNMIHSPFLEWTLYFYASAWVIPSTSNTLSAPSALPFVVHPSRPRIKAFMALALLPIGLTKWLSHPPDSCREGDKDSYRIGLDSALLYFLARWRGKSFKCVKPGFPQCKVGIKMLPTSHACCGEQMKHTVYKFSVGSSAEKTAILRGAVLVPDSQVRRRTTRWPVPKVQCLFIHWFIYKSLSIEFLLRFKHCEAWDVVVKQDG